MLWFRNSGLLLILAALCLALFATCTEAPQISRPTSEATVTPAGDQPAGTPSPVQVVETAVPSLPGEIKSLELAGYLSSALIGTFDLRGELAYVGQGRMLAIVRLAGRAQPQRVGYVVLPNDILDVAVAGDPSDGWARAYLALGAGGLAVVDLADPSRPAVHNTYLEGVHVNAVAVDEDKLYVSAGALYVLDLSVRADLADSLARAESVAYRPADSMGNAGKVLAVSDGRAYLLYRSGFGQAGSLRIVDLSEPAAPIEVGVYRAGLPIREGAVADGYAYLLVGEGVPYLVVVDLADPAHPMAVDPQGAKTWSEQSLAAAGQTLYLASFDTVDGSGQVQVLDVTDPTRPLSLGIYEGVSAPIVEIAASGAQVVFAAGASLVFVDVSNPEMPVAAGRYDSPRLPGVHRDVAAAGDHVYIAAASDGLWAVDVSDPGNPRVAGSLYTGGPVWGVALWGRYALVADGSSALWVVDVSDPTNLVEVGDYSVPGLSAFFSDVAIDVQSSSERAFAYVADSLPGDTSLRVIDLSDPAAPTEISRLPLGSGVQGDVRAYGVAVDGGYAYLGVGAAGLRIVNVSDPYEPVEVAALDVPGRADNLVAADDRVYLVDGDLRIVDVSDPSSPREVGFYDVPNMSAWPYVAVSGRYAFLTAEGTRILDLSEPAVPVEIAGYPLGHGAIAVDDGWVYVLGDGLYIFRPSADADPLPTATPTPECTNYSAEMSLSAADTELYVGDVVTVTATLINQGCGMIGLPRYSVHVEADGDQALFEAMPEAVVHYTGIVPGQSDAVEFPLRAVRTGQTTLGAGVSFDFHAGYPGPAWWGGASAAPLQITVRSPDAEQELEGDRCSPDQARRVDRDR